MYQSTSSHLLSNGNIEIIDAKYIFFPQNIGIDQTLINQ